MDVQPPMVALVSLLLAGAALVLLTPPAPLTAQIDGSYFGGGPGQVLSTPTAFGIGWREVYLGAGAFDRTRYHHNTDGAVFGGFGIGDAEDRLAVELTITSYSTWKRGLFTRTGVTLKAHRRLNDHLAIAVGAENVFRLGPNYAGEGVFAAVSSRWERDARLLHRFATTGGMGTGRFGSEDDFFAGRPSAGPFGSVSVGLIGPVAAVAEWRQDLTLGGSLGPLPSVPMRLAAGVVDVLGRAGDGRRIALGAVLDVNLKGPRACSGCD